MDQSARISIVGAGLAGLTVGGLLQKQGYQVSVFEQAESFWRVGSGITLGPNTAKVMRRLGAEEAMVRTGIKPDAYVSRDAKTGETLNELLFDREAEQRFGGPFVNIHRADLHQILVSKVKPGTIRFNHELAGLTHSLNAVTLEFANGNRVESDIVIGADGIRSIVRDAIQGKQPPNYVGKVAVRAVFPAEKLAGLQIRDCTKWWDDDRHLIAYYMSDRRDECYVMGAIPSDEWQEDTPPREGTRKELLESFPTAHPDMSGLMLAAETVQLLPICYRARNDAWSDGAVVLAGDACHAVPPFMAAGGSMAIEDAAILARAIVSEDTAQQAFEIYRSLRIPRVAEVQRISAENSWLKLPGDTQWFYGYDPYDHELKNAA